MTTPFHQPLPVTVMLRNQKFATVEQCVAPACGFNLLGHLNHDPGRPEAWRPDGRWLESGDTHPLDIIAEVIGGKVHVLAAAAGKKGPIV